MIRHLSQKFMNRNLLFVDDDESIRSLASLFFDSMKRYKLFLAKNAKEGLEIAQSNKIHAAIIDVKMPGEDGFWLLEKIANSSFHIPCIMISGGCDINDAQRSHDLGAKLYIAKPFDINILTKEIDKILTKSKDRNEAHYASQSTFNAINQNLLNFINSTRIDDEGNLPVVASPHD